MTLALHPGLSDKVLTVMCLLLPMDANKQACLHSHGCLPFCILHVLWLQGILHDLVVTTRHDKAHMTCFVQQDLLSAVRVCTP